MGSERPVLSTVCSAVFSVLDNGWISVHYFLYKHRVLYHAEDERCAAWRVLFLCLCRSNRWDPRHDVFGLSVRVCVRARPSRGILRRSVSRVYVTVGRPCACLSHRSTTATAAGGFAAECRRLQQLSIDSCGRRAAVASAQQQMRVASC